MGEIAETVDSIPEHPLWHPDLTALLKRHERYSRPFPLGEPVYDLQEVISDWLRDQRLDSIADGVMQNDKRFLSAYLTGARMAVLHEERFWEAWGSLQGR